MNTRPIFGLPKKLTLCHREYRWVKTLLKYAKNDHQIKNIILKWNVKQSPRFPRSFVRYHLNEHTSDSLRFTTFMVYNILKSNLKPKRDKLGYKFIPPFNE